MPQHSAKLLISLLLVLVTVLGAPAAVAQDGHGILEFFANGEDFVRQGFVSKDGWQITFESLPIGIADIVAYQADSPYDVEEGGEIVASHR